jgi:hypothetical protein
MLSVGVNVPGCAITNEAGLTSTARERRSRRPHFCDVLALFAVVTMWPSLSGRGTHRLEQTDEALRKKVGLPE